MRATRGPAHGKTKPTTIGERGKTEFSLEKAMKKMLFVAIAAVLAGTQVHAQDRGYDDRDAPSQMDNSKVAWADVLRVDPIFEQVQSNNPREECEEYPVERPVDNGNRAAGTVLGAIVGGVLGSTVGKGDGRRAATVAGAVVGGAVGNNVGRNNDGGYYMDSERRCRIVNEVSEERRIVAYDVQYRYRGDVYMSRLNYDPGDRLRVRVSIEPVE